MNIYSICGIAMITCIFVILIKQYRAEYAQALAVIATVMLTALALSFLDTVIADLINVAQVYTAAQAIEPVVKCLGICIITQMTADVARDCSQQAIATKVELCGKAGMLVSVMPLVLELMNIAVDIINLSK